MKGFSITLLFFAFCFSVFSQPYPAVPLIPKPVLFNEQLKNTSYLLHQPNKEIRIMVYGQSISAQEWWKDVKTYFETKYPRSKINFINKAIGGFSSDRLKLTVTNDVMSFYPDLILFHDYGNEDDYEKIIRIIRSKTTADIAIQTDHMANQGQEWHDQHSNIWLPSLCRKYGLALLDIRRYWKEYLQKNNLQIEELLSDGIHLNEHGNYLMAGIIRNYFNNLSHEPSPDTRISVLKNGKDFKVDNGIIQVLINGNRADVKSDKAANNKPLSLGMERQTLKSNNNCYYYTRPALRPGQFFLTNIGVLLAMDLSDKVQEEDYALTILSVDSVLQQLAFSLKGSMTGEDGTGNSGTLFTSRSGKITISPESWFVRKSKNDFAQFHWLQPGDVLHWKIKSMCNDRTRLLSDSTQTLFQGIRNRQHKLTIEGSGTKHIKEIIVYKPMLEEE